MDFHPYNLRNQLSPRHAVRKCLQCIGLMRVTFFFFVVVSRSGAADTMRRLDLSPIHAHNSEDEISEAANNDEPRIRALDADSLGL